MQINIKVQELSRDILHFGGLFLIEAPTLLLRGKFKFYVDWKHNYLTVFKGETVFYKTQLPISLEEIKLKPLHEKIVGVLIIELLNRHLGKDFGPIKLAPLEESALVSALQIACS